MYDQRRYETALKDPYDYNFLLIQRTSAVVIPCAADQASIQHINDDCPICQHKMFKTTAYEAIAETTIDGKHYVTADEPVVEATGCGHLMHEGCYESYVVSQMPIVRKRRQSSTSQLIKGDSVHPLSIFNSPFPVP